MVGGLVVLLEPVGSTTTLVRLSVVGSSFDHGAVGSKRCHWVSEKVSRTKCVLRTFHLLRLFASRTLRFMKCVARGVTFFVLHNSPSIAQASASLLGFNTMFRMSLITICNSECVPRLVQTRSSASWQKAVAVILRPTRSAKSWNWTSMADL